MDARSELLNVFFHTAMCISLLPVMYFNAIFFYSKLCQMLTLQNQKLQTTANN